MMRQNKFSNTKACFKWQINIIGKEDRFQRNTSNNLAVKYVPIELDERGNSI